MATPKRGGQPSNVNSRRHGFYSKKLDASILPELAEAAQVVGLDAEIAFLRVMLRNLASSNRNISLTLDCYKTLSGLVKNQYLISIDHDESLKNAISLVLNEIAAPLKIKKLIR